LTARRDVADRVAGLDAGADDYLAKPFELDELFARTRALMRRRNAESVMRVGPFVLDRAERRLLVDGQPIDLTPREFTLFACLMREPGAVFSRADLLSRVWGLRFDPGTNVLEVHVRRLREKLGGHGRY